MVSGRGNPILGLAIGIGFAGIIIGCQLQKSSDSAPGPSKTVDEEWVSLELELKQSCTELGKETGEYCACSAKVETGIYRQRYGKVEAMPDNVELDASETSQIEEVCKPKPEKDSNDSDDSSLPIPPVTQPNLAPPASTPVTLAMLEGDYTINSFSVQPYRTFEITDTASGAFEMKYEDNLSTGSGTAKGKLTLVAPNLLEWKVESTSYKPNFSLGTYRCRFELSGKAPARKFAIACGTSSGSVPLDMTSAISLPESKCYNCD